VRCRSVAVFGIEAYEVEVEVDVRSGLPEVTFVGLPDTVVREARSQEGRRTARPRQGMD